MGGRDQDQEDYLRYTAVGHLHDMLSKIRVFSVPIMAIMTLFLMNTGGLKKSDYQE